MKSEIKVKISDIGEEGYALHDSLDAEYIGLTSDDALYFITQLKIDAALQKIEDTVLANVRASGRFSTSCYRSMVTVERNWSTEFSLDYKINELDQYIEMAEDIRQEIILAIPLRVLSDEELKKEPHGEDVRTEVDLPTLGGEPPSDTYRPFKNL